MELLELLEIKFLQKIPLHPFLFGIFPILSLYESSMKFIPETELIFPLSIILSITALFLIVFKKLFKKLFKNNHKSEIIVSILIFFGLIYGSVYFLLDDFHIDEFDFGKHRYLLPIGFLIIAVGIYFILKQNNDFNSLHKILNLISLIMVLVIISNILYYEISVFKNLEIGEEIKILTNSNSKPDVYFILLDGYPGEDSLKKIIGFDNDEFISNMEGIGFFNQKKSYANYPHTFLSIPSMLNMKYLNYLDEMLMQTRDQSIPYSLGSNSEVITIANDLGYLTISFDSGWGFTRDIKNTDLNLCGDNQFLNSEFMINIVKRSILNPIYVKIYETDLAEMRLCVLNELPLIHDRSDSPKFVFAHIFMPHPPYIFDEFGNLNELKTIEPNLENEINLNQDLFLNQLKFVNHKIYDISKKIIEQNNDAIIIISSDHGTAFTFEGKKENWNNATNEMISERMDILFLSYTPNQEKILYENVHTPVNFFRVFFSHYHNLDFPILPDAVYFGEDGYYNLINKTELFFN